MNMWHTATTGPVTSKLATQRRFKPFCDLFWNLAVVWCTRVRNLWMVRKCFVDSVSMTTLIQLNTNIKLTFCAWPQNFSQKHTFCPTRFFVLHFVWGWLLLVSNGNRDRSTRVQSFWDSEKQAILQVFLCETNLFSSVASVLCWSCMPLASK